MRYALISLLLLLSLAQAARADDELGDRLPALAEKYIDTGKFDAAVSVILAEAAAGADITAAVITKATENPAFALPLIRGVLAEARKLPGDSEGDKKLERLGLRVELLAESSAAILAFGSPFLWRKEMPAMVDCIDVRWLKAMAQVTPAEFDAFANSEKLFSFGFEMPEVRRNERNGAYLHVVHEQKNPKVARYQLVLLTLNREYDLDLATEKVQALFSLLDDISAGRAIESANLEVKIKEPSKQELLTMQALEREVVRGFPRVPTLFMLNVFGDGHPQAEKQFLKLLKAAEMTKSEKMREFALEALIRIKNPSESVQNILLAQFLGRDWSKQSESDKKISNLAKFALEDLAKSEKGLAEGVLTEIWKAFRDLSSQDARGILRVIKPLPPAIEKEILDSPTVERVELLLATKTLSPKAERLAIDYWIESKILPVYLNNAAISLNAMDNATRELIESENSTEREKGLKAAATLRTPMSKALFEAVVALGPNAAAHDLLALRASQRPEVIALLIMYKSESALEKLTTVPRSSIPSLIGLLDHANKNVQFNVMQAIFRERSWSPQMFALLFEKMAEMPRTSFIRQQIASQLQQRYARYSGDHLLRHLKITSLEEQQALQKAIDKLSRSVASFSDLDNWLSTTRTKLCEWGLTQAGE